MIARGIEKQVKRSKQRDAVISQLSNRGDHPTAETLYNELKESMPNLSLATVYRNLRQLESWGEISSIASDGATRFDHDPRPHSHFFCTECGGVTDLDDDNESIVRLGQERFPGKIMGCYSNYYGICQNCLKRS
jgi:Fur family peroxide stress response transcriptional regulator